MDLNPTQDPRIFQTNWFTDPEQPLIEHKVFYAKSDRLLTYVTCHRGPTLDNLDPSEDPKTVQLADNIGMSDNEQDQFVKLVRYLNKPL